MNLSNISKKFEEQYTYFIEYKIDCVNFYRKVISNFHKYINASTASIQVITPENYENYFSDNLEVYDIELIRMYGMSHIIPNMNNSYIFSKDIGNKWIMIPTILYLFEVDRVSNENIAILINFFITKYIEDQDSYQLKIGIKAEKNNNFIFDGNLENNENYHKKDQLFDYIENKIDQIYSDVIMKNYSINKTIILR